MTDLLSARQKMKGMNIVAVEIVEVVEKMA